MLYSAQYISEIRDKNGKLLAFLSKPTHEPFTITRIVDGTGNMHESTESIMAASLLLYTSRIQYAQAGYLQLVILISLTSEDRNFIDGPIQVDELESAVGQFAKHKTPSLDGLPI